MSYNKAMSLGRLSRAFALILLGVMLLVRMGPMCESVAQAAPLVGARAAMADCDRAPSAPVKKAPPAACAGTCIATSAEVHVPPLRWLAPSSSAIVSLHPVLEGRPGGPSPPPPRTA